jgi:hypothetical protein
MSVSIQTGIAERPPATSLRPCKDQSASASDHDQQECGYVQKPVFEKGETKENGSNHNEIGGRSVLGNAWQ